MPVWIERFVLIASQWQHTKKRNRSKCIEMCCEPKDFVSKEWRCSHPWLTCANESVRFSSSRPIQSDQPTMNATVSRVKHHLSIVLNVSSCSLTIQNCILRLQTRMLQILHNHKSQKEMIFIYSNEQPTGIRCLHRMYEWIVMPDGHNGWRQRIWSHCNGIRHMPPNKERLVSPSVKRICASFSSSNKKA